MEQDQVAQAFTKDYNKAEDFFEKDELEACIEECQELLEKPDCPCYYRIKTLILLGSSIDDLSEVGECNQEASRLWALARDVHSRNDAAANEALEELKESLDSLLECIGQEVGKYNVRLQSELEDEDEGMLEEPHAVAETEREMEGEGEGGELRKADIAVLGEKDHQVEPKTAPVFEGPSEHQKRNAKRWPRSQARQSYRRGWRR